MLRASGWTDTAFVLGRAISTPKLSDDARRRLPLKPIYFLAPED